MTATRPSPTASTRAVWRASASPGGLIGLLALFVCLSIAAFLLWRVLPDQDSPGLQAVLVVFIAVLVAGGVILTYLLYGYFTMSYLLDRQQLIIRWGRSRYSIPLSSIEYVGQASQILEGQRPGTNLPWPGYYLEAYPAFNGVSVRTFATHPLHRQVMICTPEAFYALSPDRPIRFMEELVRLRERVSTPPPEARASNEGAPRAPTFASGHTQQLPSINQFLEPTATSRLGRRIPAPASEPPATPTAAAGARAAARPMSAGRAGRALPAANAPAPTSPDRRPSAPPALWHDRGARILFGGALLLVVGMVIFIFVKLPTLPDRIPLHFNALGQVDRIGQPGEILWLPGIVVSVILANALLALSVQRYDAIAARLLLAGPIVTGLIAWVAVVHLL